VIDYQPFLENFHLIGDDPEIISRLRKLLVVLAITGKISESSANSMTSLEVLQLLISENSNQNTTRSTNLSLSSELPLNMPNTVLFAPLGDVAFIKKGPTGISSAKPGEYPLVVTAEGRLSCDHFDFEGACAIIPLVSSTGHGNASLHRLHYQEGRFALGSILAAVFPINSELISARFLFEYLSAFKEELLVSKMGGTANVSLSIGKIKEVPIPIVTPAVQRLIDQLMALCDQLEAARADREQLRSQFSAATLARLNQPSEDQAAFRADAGFALQHFATLSATPAQIKALRQTILNLAVRGKLVPQDPNDEPARVLLERIAEEKVAKGQIKRNNQDSIDLDIEPFELPLGWNWIKFGELIIHSESGWSPKTENYPRQGDAWGVLKVSAVSWGVFRAWENKQVLPNTEPRLQAQIKRGDFLISRANTAELIARAVIVHEEPYNLMMSDKIVRLTLSDYCDHYFICMLNNNAKFARIHYERNASGVSPSMKNISREVIMNLPIPLPPLAEQKRIVAKVDQLMALCDQLEASLQQAESIQHQLLKAVLHSALEPVEQLEAA
jgi:type I restriction enzyme S subunit